MSRVTPAWMANYSGVILLMILLLNLALLLPRFAYGLTLPFMEDSLALSRFQEGSFFTALSISGVAGALTFGVLASRYGSRIIIGVTAISGGVAVGVLGISTNYWFALGMSALVGFTTLGSIAPAMGLLSAWFDSRNRGTASGLVASGGGLCFIVIGALVPWLTGRDPEDGWRHLWYIMGAIVVVVGVLSLKLLKDRPIEAGEATRSMGAWPTAVYRNPLVWLASLLAFCSGWCEGLFATFFGVYLEEHGISVAISGGLWMMVGLLGIVGGVFWGILSDRTSRGTAFMLSFLIVGVGLLLFWITPVLGGFVAASVFFGVSFRAAYIICAAAAGDYVRPQFAAAAFGLMGMGAGLGGAIGPPLGGYIADTTGDLSWAFVLGAGGAAVAVFSSIFLNRSRASQ